MKGFKINQKLQITIFAIILTTVTFAGVYFVSKGKDRGTITKANCAPGVTCVYLKGNHAEPDAITVAVGDYVQVNSADGQTHDIASGSGDENHTGAHVHTDGAESGSFKADEAWKVQFKTAGTFDFHDHYHPEIHFTVIAYIPGGDYKIKS